MLNSLLVTILQTIVPERKRKKEVSVLEAGREGGERESEDIYGVKWTLVKRREEMVF